jgi:tmRNA-binding protein
VERKGYALIPTAMYWSHGRAKLEIGLAKGKKEFDKRATLKDRDWQRSTSVSRIPQTSSRRRTRALARHQFVVDEADDRRARCG